MIKSGLDTIVDDMAYAVMRTARSPIVRDVLDYSVTLCDGRGRILAQAKTVALHLGAVPDAMDVVLAHSRATLSRRRDRSQRPLRRRDAPARHLHVQADFRRGGLLGFAVVIAHHCDMGGRVPGSNASDSTEIFQEGLRIAPMKLYDRGEPNRTLLKIIEKNVRLPDLVLGDLDAQYATCDIGERELLRLHARYGDELEVVFRPADRLWRGADAQGDRRLAGRRRIAFTD